MDFVEAMERLKRMVTDEEIAMAIGVSVNTIRRTRADPSTRNYRPPPGGWNAALSKLTEARISELERLRKELDEADWTTEEEASPHRRNHLPRARK